MDQPKKKCLNCRYYRPSNYFHGVFERGFCYVPSLRTTTAKLPIKITRAREICDKEGDGIFTLFEPRHAEVAA